MSNVYYNYSGNFIPGTLARAETVSSEFSSVATGFSKLSTQGVDTGTANVYVVATTGYPVAAYQDGNNIQFEAIHTNTGSSTINVNSIGAVPLLRFNGNALVAGDVVAGAWYTCIYTVLYGGFTIVSPTAYATFAGTISLAPPTNKVGLVASGGAATAAVPIDATYAIDQAIAPTWTGAHIFSGHAIQAGTPTGGDIGTGKVNVSSGYYVNNVLLAAGGVTSVSGTANQITASPTTGAVVLSLPQNVIVPTPASGVALTVTGVAGASAAQFLTTGVQIGSPTGGDKGSGTLNVASNLYINNAAVVAGTGAGTTITGTANQIAASASTGAVTLSLPQNVIIPTPVGGVALTVTGVGGSTQALNVFSQGSQIIADFDCANSSGGYIAYTRSTVAKAYLGDSSALDSGTIDDITLRSQAALGLSTGGGSRRITISVTGVVTIAAPSSGVALTVSAVAGTHSTKIADSLNNSFNAGFLEIPQNSKSAAYTTVLSDSGKHIYHPSADTTARIWTIDSNANVAYPIGTAITFDNDISAGIVTLAITSDTLVWLPTGSTGSRSLAAGAQATALKVTSTRWHLVGVGIT